MKRTVHPVTVGGRNLELSNLGKVMYPASGTTKAEVLDYYLKIAPVLLPHLAGRPLNLKRYPDGVEGPHFYQKECPAYHPGWMSIAQVWSDEKQATIHHCCADDEASLAWLVNTGNLEIHSFLGKRDALERPSFLVFDLDPGPGADLRTCSQVALSIRDLLRSWNLAAYPKVSGGKGLQPYVPLNTKVTYETTRPLSKAIAEELAKQQPGLITANMSKAQRARKVLVDWSQNHAHKSTVAVYSLRARPIPSVSAPVTWKEVEQAASGDDDGESVLRFTPAMVLERIRHKGDLFRPVLEKKQRLPAIGA